MTNQELNDLFASFSSKNTQAFSAVYEELKQPVYTICLRILGSREMAEDVCHDVFLKLFQSPPDASVRNARAWVFRIARNQSIDALRRKENTETADLDTVTAACHPDWDTRLDLEKAIRCLDVQEREILTLHLNADLGFGEISRITGLSLASVYRRYRAALKKLQTILNGGTL